MTEILPLTSAHIASLSAAMVSVAREGIPGAFETIPTSYDVMTFARHSLLLHRPHVVAVEGHRVVGWCHIVAIPLLMVRQTMVTIGGQFHQLGTGVLPSWRGKGVARRLVESAVNMAFDRGAARVHLDTVEANEPAVRLYHRCGFNIDYKRKKPFSSEIEIGMSRAK